MARDIVEGFLPFRGHRTWYRMVGRDEPGRSPLLCLHGGPGIPHDYLEPLEALADTGRRVVFYDQLGCGNSAHPHDPSLWTVELFLDELATVRRALALDHLHLYGQSWGGMLAVEHAIRHPRGLRSLLLADTPLSMPVWCEETRRLREQLPDAVRTVLETHEKAGTTDSPAYLDAVMVFYRRHVCRLDPWPECLQRAFRKMLQDPEVYATMIGPSEFDVTGTLRDWDVSDRLGEIDVPTLVLSGRYDEATPDMEAELARRIPGAAWLLLEDSAHMGHVEEPELFLRVVGDFLEHVESRRPGFVATRAGAFASAPAP